MTINVVLHFGLVQISDAQHFLQFRHGAGQLGRCDLIGCLPLFNCLFHLAFVGIQIGECVVHLDNVESLTVGHAGRIRRIQALLNVGNHRGQRSLADVTHGVQILVPSLGLGKIAVSQVRFPFASDVGGIPDRAGGG